MISLYPPPRMPVTNEGLGWDSLLKMVHNPGGDEPASWVEGIVPIYDFASQFFALHHFQASFQGCLLTPFKP